MLLNMCQRWADHLHHGHEIRCVALDMSKAFDKVWHDGLCLKLARLGVSGSLLLWLRSFLSGRFQRVVVGQSCSSFLRVLAGVPQGSVLAPLLFLVFINDMFDCVSNNLDAFADDSTLWAPVPSSSHRLSVSLSLNADLVQGSEMARII